ncbi:unnamed protein product, partial [Cyprideis torosa]
MGAENNAVVLKAPELLDRGWVSVAVKTEGILGHCDVIIEPVKFLGNEPLWSLANLFVNVVFNLAFKIFKDHLSQEPITSTLIEQQL